MTATDKVPKTYLTKVKIRFRDADPAGILFFANVLKLAHDVFEEFIVEAGISWPEWFEPLEWACPIRHTEVNHLSPLKPGESYNVSASVKNLSQSSFNMVYIFESSDGKPCAKVSMIHTFVNKKTFQKSDIPSKYRSLLEVYWEPS